MRQRDRALLHDILSIQSKSRQQGAMIEFMEDHLKEAGMDVVKAGEQLYARKGNANLTVPYFVAHADTVHRIVPDEQYRVTAVMATDGDIIYRAYDPTTGRSRGVGGDDKCGLYACLIAAQELDDVGVLITVDEEVGCVGAGRVHEELLVRPGCMIQLDRRGNGDAVDAIGGPIMSRAFKGLIDPIVQRYGYRWVQGMITDVGTLSYNLMLSAINLSAGYYDPHMDSEYISETDLEFAVELALDIALEAGNNEWTIPRDELEYRKSTYARGWSRAGNRLWDDYDDSAALYETWQAKGKATPEAEEEELDGFLDTFFEQGIERYEHAVRVGNASHTVQVDLERPENWNFKELGAHAFFSDEEIEEIEGKIMQYWIDNVEPVLIYMEVDAGDDRDIPPADFRPLQSSLAEEVVREALNVKDDELCDVEGCIHLYVRYDVISRMWMCHNHYDTLSKDPDDLKKLVKEQTDILANVKGGGANKHKMVKNLCEALHASHARGAAIDANDNPPIVA